MTGEEEPRSAGLEETVRMHLSVRTDSGYSIAKQAGISRQQFYRFVRGERGLTLDSLDKLCYVLGLALTPINRAGPLNEVQAARSEATQARIEAKKKELLQKDEARRRAKGKSEEQ